ncbi:hypothetical protein HDK90DRAFT_142637 [Phyllosticta capitalensis]|uniref:R3H domain-containing protein n=1 Tax=Phyllosticta capitalensis TaxID=121624 RepID=A0ABR1YZ63_9PEZI
MSADITSSAAAAPGPETNASRRNRNRGQRPRNNAQSEVTGDSGQPIQPQQPQQQQTTARRGGRAGRGGRGNRGSGQPARQSAPAASPNPGVHEPVQTPQETVNTTSDHAGATPDGNNAGRGGRSRRGGQQGRGGAQNRRGQNQGRGGSQASRGQNIRTFQGRTFGGQLTATDAVDPSPGSALQPDAPDFQPGQPPRSRNVAQTRPRKRRASRSKAPDITTRVHEDIDNGHYECAICTNEVHRNSRMWSCRTCWTVFHLKCIGEWASNSLKEHSDRPWRCPGCNLPQEKVPKHFNCWCQKEQDPKSIPGMPPFSCGQTCGRKRAVPKSCPHPCPEICHAGPCPPCGQMGPTQSCFCGKETKTQKCLNTDYENGFSCGQVCGELMPCDEHFCERPCHEGLCGACEVLVEARCYCGQEEKPMMCADRADEKDSKRTYNRDNGEKFVEEWTGVFECAKTCARYFDCGKHQCQKPCHAQEQPVSHCPRSPELVFFCPCGKTPLNQITDKTRTSCEDPIPNCNQRCNKPLACGHVCLQVCHSGDCDRLPCLQKTPISCRCGKTTLTTICHQGMVEQPYCMRTCRVTMNCGRHTCGERCCPGEKKAAERTSKRPTRRRPHELGEAVPVEMVEAEHVCVERCGRLLKCDNHQCEELCHKGPCRSCRDAVFEEISCACGRTVLEPPLPCGTRPPPCRYECERPKACGHPQVTHNCHQDEEACPKCPYLTVKECMCGKNILKNQPCWLQEARCGEICGKKLRCGAHRCRKPCHKPGDCEDSGAVCKQECGKEKTCGHPCSIPCHSPYACDESKPCQYKIHITCPCQRSKQEAKCLATKDSQGNLEKTLKCDDECARLERNRKLALALNVNADANKDDHIPYSAETLSLYQNSVQWAQTQEREFRVFASSPEEKRLRFKPMSTQQRAFIHALAEDFGLDHESMDPPPHRHVLIYKTPRFVSAPAKTVGECVRIRYNQRVAQPKASSDTSKLKSSNLLGDPFNSFLLGSPRFGLTIEDLRACVRPVLDSVPGIPFDISFLPSDEVVLKANPPATMGSREVETALKNIKAALAREARKHSLGSIQLCRTDASLNVLNRETDQADNGGWSQVAAKAAAPVRRPAAAHGSGSSTPTSSNGYTILATSTMKGKKKAVEKMREEAVDDWEAAEAEAEERERGESGGASRVESEDETTGKDLPSTAAPEEVKAGDQTQGEPLDLEALSASLPSLATREGGGLSWADSLDEADA